MLLTLAHIKIKRTPIRRSQRECEQESAVHSLAMPALHILQNLFSLILWNTMLCAKLVRFQSRVCAPVDSNGDAHSISEDDGHEKFNWMLRDRGYALLSNSLDLIEAGIRELVF